MKKKTLTIAIALVLVVALAVGATWAYLAQTTKTVQNTFAVGSILDNDGEFTLKEHELANPDATDGAYKVLRPVRLVMPTLVSPIGPLCRV